jgi:hypothetical protein
MANYISGTHFMEKERKWFFVSNRLKAEGTMICNTLSSKFNFFTVVVPVPHSITYNSNKMDRIAHRVTALLFYFFGLVTLCASIDRALFPCLVTLCTSIDRAVFPCLVRLCAAGGRAEISRPPTFRPRICLKTSTFL